MTDPTPETSEADEPSPSRAWFGLSLLTWSIALSMLLHSSVLIPAFLDLFQPSEADVDLEWLKSFDELEGLGHGSSGRFAELDAASFATRNEEPEPAVPQAAAEPEPPAPEPKPIEEPEPVEVEPEAQPTPPAPEERAENSEPTEKTEPAPDKKPEEVYSEGELPGLDRAGPNGLPAMEGYGPGNAVFTALVRLDRIRGSRFEDSTRKLLEAVPDYRILLQGTEIDPLKDLDSMFMASSDPVYIEETFLAVRHHLGRDELRRRLDQRFDTKIAWSTSAGYPTRDLVPAGSRYTDPRKIMVPANNLALVVRPEWIGELTSALPSDSALLQGVETKKLSRLPSMLDGLTHIERAVTSSDTVVLMSAMGARLALPGIGRLTFDGAKLEVAGIERPRLTIDLTLATEAEAKRFASGCPGLKSRLLARVPWIAKNITRMVVDRLSCEAEGRYVTVAGVYTAEEAERLLNIALPFVPRPTELAYLPPGPPPKLPAVTTARDAGNASAAESDAGEAAVEPRSVPSSELRDDQDGGHAEQKGEQ